MPVPEALQQALQVWIDQDLCTGDGLCSQVAPEVFELDVDGLAYVKGRDGELRTSPGARVDVPDGVLGDVLEAARDCPGTCIFVAGTDGTPVAGPGTD